MGDLFGGTGKSGSNNPQQTQYPYFTSPGGVTPEQAAFGEYDYGQNLVTGQAEFQGGGPGGGTGMSTMDTQVAGGANMGKALNLAGSSDANQNAELKAYENAISVDQQNQGAALAESQANTTALDSTLGSLAGIASVKPATTTTTATQ